MDCLVLRFNKNGEDPLSDGVCSGYVALDGKSCGARDYVALGPISLEIRLQPI